jgi:hypothetical protein
MPRAESSIAITRGSARFGKARSTSTWSRSLTLFPLGNHVAAAENTDKRSDDVEHCKRAMADHALPFLEELKQQMGDQFSYAAQIDVSDHKPVGVTFKIGDGAPTSISTGFGSIVLTQQQRLLQGSGLRLRPDAEPLTRAISSAINLPSCLRVVAAPGLGGAQPASRNANAAAGCGTTNRSRIESVSGRDDDLQPRWNDPPARFRLRLRG